MVTSNGHWNYCSSILRRKGRKRWITTGTHNDDNSHMCPKSREKFPYYHFLMGSRLWCPIRQQSRVTIFTEWLCNVLSQIFRSSTCNIHYLSWFLITFLSLSCLSTPPVTAAAQDYYRSNNDESKLILINSLLFLRASRNCKNS